MIEKVFVAAELDRAPGGQYGPFKTSGEAEIAARQLGWKWVCVYTYTLRGDVIIDTATRFYPLPDEVDSLRRKLVRAKEAAVAPMSDSEREFFDRYEGDVQEGIQDVADLATKAAGWTTNDRMSAQLRRYGKR
jgi:hypothetical protein